MSDSLKFSEIRRQLLNMTTHDTLVFGRLAVRIFIHRGSVRWQMDDGEVKQSYSYTVYPSGDYILGVIDQIGVRNEALAKATAYIMANHSRAARGHVTDCPECGYPIIARRATYCSTKCREKAYRRRKKAIA